jgi:hypothetical protein
MNRLMKPKYLVRPDDLEIFSLNSDDETYSLDFIKKKYPESLYNRYSLDRLINIDFFPAGDKDLPRLRSQKNKEENRIRRLREQNGGCGDDGDD